MIKVSLWKKVLFEWKNEKVKVIHWFQDELSDANAQRYGYSNPLFYLHFFDLYKEIDAANHYLHFIRMYLIYFI